MTETVLSDPSGAIPQTPAASGPSSGQPNRLYQAAAWVAIAAGAVFIAATIFGAGFLLGRQSGADHGWRHHPWGGQAARMGPPMMPGGPGAQVPPPGGPSAQVPPPGGPSAQVPPPRP